MKDLVNKTELKSFVKENTWLTRGSYGMDFGWGNGYVCIPEGHPCFGMDYNEIHNQYSIDVNGGLTFSDWSENLPWPEIPEGNWWVVGFDTAHSWDDLQSWPKFMVETEAINLMNQLIELRPQSN